MDPQVTPSTQPSSSTPGGSATPSTPPQAGSHNTNQQKSSGSNKLMVTLAVILLVLVAGAVGYAATHKKTPTQSTQQSAYGTNEQPEDGTLQTEAELSDFKQEAEITITASGYAPQTLTMPNNTKIIWHNTDTKAHTIAITPGTTVPNKFYNTNNKIAAGGGYPFVIHQTGTFHYYDVDNPTLTGEFTIQ